MVWHSVEMHQGRKIIWCSPLAEMLRGYFPNCCSFPLVSHLTAGINSGMAMLLRMAILRCNTSEFACINCSGDSVSRSQILPGREPSLRCAPLRR